MKRSSPLTLKVLLFLSFFLNSCGYELRTYSSGLSSQTVHFEGDNSDLNLDLKNTLKEMNNVLRANGKDSDLKIKMAVAILPFETAGLFKVFDIPPVNRVLSK